MASDVLTLEIDSTVNVPLLIGGSTSFTMNIKNISPNVKLYNLSIFITLPDGLSILTATLPQTSQVTNPDGSSLSTWISLKDLAPLEASYSFNVTVKSGTKFKDGTTIPFGYIFTGITAKCQVDTQPRGNDDIGNLKISQQLPMTFKATRFSGSVATSGKVLKGAGTALNLTDYTRVYSATCKFANNSVMTSTVTISILLEDGIRYLDTIVASGTDRSSLLTPTVSTVQINNKQYVQLHYGSVLLSLNSATTVTFNYAVWNKYNNNQDGLIAHGTPLKLLVQMSSTEDSLEASTSFSAMDLIIVTSTTKALVDVQDLVQYNYTYSVGQYYDIQSIVVDYLLPDGLTYLSSSVVPFSVVDNPSLKGYELIYHFPPALRNSENTVNIGARMDSYYRYKNSPNPLLPVVSADSFRVTTTITGTTVELNTPVPDNASTNSSIKVATIKKEFLKGYYRSGVAKAITPLAPGDLAEYKLTYDATTLKAIQKQLYLVDFFPLSADPIIGLVYSYSGYIPPSLTPLPIDPHGVQFYYGDVDGQTLSTITFKAPIKFLGTAAQNTNLMKLTGSNTNGVTYSNRTQVAINIGTPNLLLTKSVTGPNRNEIKAGETYSYTVKVSNTNTLGTETDAFDFQVVDSFSPWFTLNPVTITVTGTGSYSTPIFDTNRITLPVTKLAPGQSLTLFYSVTIINLLAPGLTITTVASNTNPYSQTYDPTLDNFQYTNQNRTASVTISSLKITLNKLNNTALFKVNSEITYTITLTIPQGTTAYDVNVKDTLPSGGQAYSGSATRNGQAITPTVLSNVITFPNEGMIDARSFSQVIIYTLTCKITNANKAVGAITSTQVNTCQVIYRQSPAGTTNTVSKNLTVTINHPNIVMSLAAKEHGGSVIYDQTAVINTNSIMDFKLTFLNNSLIMLVNGTLEIPISNNYYFSSIDQAIQCSAKYNTTSQKLILTIPQLDKSISGFVAFKLIPLSTLRAGTSIVTQATATSYYNDISTKVYSGEKSNLFTALLPAGTSLLPNPTDKVNDSTSFRVTPPGKVTTIVNFFQNSGGGYDDYTLVIQPVALPYTLYIDNTQIALVATNTLYVADLTIMKNLAPGDWRTITIMATIPQQTPSGARFDFVVTARSKTSPYPEKTVLNIDPS